MADIEIHLQKISQLLTSLRSPQIFISQLTKTTLIRAVKQDLVF